ncbi:TPA: ead/Ea22-like family protein [Citrobacter freundii]|nr:ead/Ea22-like family protein [Citrobacter freundii]
MTALNKQALRQTAEKAQEHGVFNMDIHSQTVLALLDENLQLQRDKDSLEAAAIAMRDDMREAREKLEAAEKRIAELEVRDINIKRQAQALFEAIANPNDCYIPAYVRCLREALNGNSTGIGVKGD